MSILSESNICYGAVFLTEYDTRGLPYRRCKECGRVFLRPFRPCIPHARPDKRVAVPEYFYLAFIGEEKWDI